MSRTRSGRPEPVPGGLAEAAADLSGVRRPDFAFDIGFARSHSPLVRRCDAGAWETTRVTV
jgi:hypothetical protein